MLLIKWPKPTKKIFFVRFNRVFVITEFVITEFDCICICELLFDWKETFVSFNAIYCPTIKCIWKLTAISYINKFLLGFFHLFSAGYNERKNGQPQAVCYSLVWLYVRKYKIQLITWTWNSWFPNSFSTTKILYCRCHLFNAGFPRYSRGLGSKNIWMLIAKRRIAKQWIT